MSDRLMSFAIEGDSSMMPRCRRAQLIPSIPVTLLAGTFSKYALTLLAVIRGIVNQDPEGSLLLTNCFSLSRLQSFVVSRDCFTLFATVVKWRLK